jgi:hypothetical protein
MERWRQQIGEDAWQRWRETGWLRIFDEANGKRARIDHAFAEDLIAVDSVGDGWPDVRAPTLILHGQHPLVREPAPGDQPAGPRLVDWLDPSRPARKDPRSA